MIKIINRSTSSELEFDLQIFPMLVVGKVNASLPTDMRVIELGVNKFVIGWFKDYQNIFNQLIIYHSGIYSEVS